jgi:hypothetical protein
MTTIAGLDMAFSTGGDPTSAIAQRQPRPRGLWLYFRLGTRSRVMVWESA